MHYEYQVGGSLKLNSPSYVTRRADIELYNAIVAGEFCYVFNARQMGKSSLRVRTQHQLKQAGIRSASLDMTSIGSRDLTPQQWYKTLAADLLRGLNLRNKVNLKIWWQEHSSISPLRQLNLLIEEIVEVHYPDEHLVIFVDEVDSALSLNFPVDDFFALIRYCYNQRADQPTYNRLSWALFGVTIPSDLMRDRQRTPFNIGRAIELQGFQEDEAVPLVAGLTNQVSNAQGVLREILHWTEGQPFLTQKLCRLVVETCDTASRCPIIIPAGTEGYWVEQIVQSQIIEDWTTQALVPLNRIIRLKSLCEKDLSHFKTKLSKSRNQRGFRAFSYPTEPVPQRKISLNICAPSAIAFYTTKLEPVGSSASISAFWQVKRLLATIAPNKLSYCYRG